MGNVPRYSIGAAPDPLAEPVKDPASGLRVRRAFGAGPSSGDRRRLFLRGRRVSPAAGHAIAW